MSNAAGFFVGGDTPLLKATISVSLGSNLVFSKAGITQNALSVVITEKTTVSELWSKILDQLELLVGPDVGKVLRVQCKTFGVWVAPVDKPHGLVMLTNDESPWKRIQQSPTHMVSVFQPVEPVMPLSARKPSRHGTIIGTLGRKKKTQAATSGQVFGVPLTRICEYSFPTESQSNGVWLAPAIVRDVMDRLRGSTQSVSELFFGTPSATKLGDIREQYELGVPVNLASAGIDELQASLLLKWWLQELPAPYIVPPEMYSVFVKVAHVVPEGEQIRWARRFLYGVDDPARVVCRELFCFFHALVSRGAAPNDADATSIATELGPWLLRGSDQDTAFSLHLTTLLARMICAGPSLFEEPDVMFAACGVVSENSAHASVDLACESGAMVFITNWDREGLRKYDAYLLNGKSGQVRAENVTINFVFSDPTKQPLSGSTRSLEESDNKNTKHKHKSSKKSSSSSSSSKKKHSHNKSKSSKGKKKSSTDKSKLVDGEADSADCPDPLAEGSFWRTVAEKHPHGAELVKNLDSPADSDEGIEPGDDSDAESDDDTLPPPVGVPPDLSAVAALAGVLTRGETSPPGPSASSSRQTSVTSSDNVLLNAAPSPVSSAEHARLVERLDAIEAQLTVAPVDLAPPPPAAVLRQDDSELERKLRELEKRLELLAAGQPDSENSASQGPAAVAVVSAQQNNAQLEELTSRLAIAEKQIVAQNNTLTQYHAVLTKTTHTVAQQYQSGQQHAALLQKQHQLILQHGELLSAQKALCAEQAQTIAKQTEELSATRNMVTTLHEEVSRLTANLGSEQESAAKKLSTLESSLTALSSASAAAAVVGASSASIPVETLDKIVKCFQVTCSAFSRNHSITNEFRQQINHLVVSLPQLGVQPVGSIDDYGVILATLRTATNALDRTQPATVGSVHVPVSPSSSPTPTSSDLHASLAKEAASAVAKQTDASVSNGVDTPTVATGPPPRKARTSMALSSSPVSSPSPKDSRTARPIRERAKMNTISMGSHTARPSILDSGSGSVYGQTLSGGRSEFASAVLAAQSPPAARAEPSNGSRVRALFEYTQGQGRSDILPFKKGDIFTQLESVSKDWARGRLDDGRQGLFPIAYVQLV